MLRLKQLSTAHDEQDVLNSNTAELASIGVGFSSKA